MKITTNHNRLRILDSWDLTVKEAEQFDYLDWDKLREGTDSASFFRFKGEVYDLGEFQRITQNDYSEIKDWDGYLSDSYFSGMLVKYAKDEDNRDDMVIVATYST